MPALLREANGVVESTVALPIMQGFVMATRGLVIPSLRLAVVAQGLIIPSLRLVTVAQLPRLGMPSR